MHVVIDIRSLQIPSSRDRGIGYCLRGWLTEFLKTPYDHRVSLLYDPHLGPMPPETPATGPFWRAVAFAVSTGDAHDAVAAEGLAQRQTEQALQALKADLFHVPSPFELSPRLGNPPTTCRTVATFHDAIPALFPELFLAKHAKPFVDAYHAKLQSLASCTRIAAVSRAAANELIRLTGVESGRIDIIYNAAAPDFLTPLSDIDLAGNALLQRIGQPYLLSVLGNGATKNTERLLAAYRQLPAELQARYKLVVTYAIPEWHRPVIQEWQERYATGDRVIFTDFVSQADLRALFTRAAWYIHPALHEGFGIPIVEAMAAGTPVMVSNTSSMPEVAGEGALTFDPYDVDDMSRCIARALNDGHLREHHQRHASTRARTFSWRASALAMRATYERALAEPQPATPAVEVHRPTPRASVIVVTCDREKHLARLMAALTRQRGAALEIVVVVGPGRDGTRAMLAGYGKTVKIVTCPVRNISRARNLGIRAAAGDVVLFIDDDALPGDDFWVARYLAAFHSDAAANTAVFGGPILARDTAEYEFNNQQATDYGFIPDVSLSPSTRALPHRWFARVSGNNCAFRRDVLTRLGGFDEYYSYYLDETDVCLRVNRQDYAIGFLPENTVRHYDAKQDGAQGITKRPWRAIARSDIYFGIKNGRDPFVTRVWRTIIWAPRKHYANEIRSWQTSLLVTTGEFREARRERYIGLASGLIAGLFLPRCMGSFGTAPPPWVDFAGK